jgi:hypothetical protein
MKRYNHINVIDMSAKRDHYTQHGLHMNKTGKEWITRKMAHIINILFANSKPAPITLIWGETDQEDSVGSNGETVKNTTLEINSGNYPCCNRVDTRRDREQAKAKYRNEGKVWDTRRGK